MARAHNTSKSTAKQAAKSASRSKSSGKSASKALKDVRTGRAPSKRSAATGTVAQRKTGAKKGTVTGRVVKRTRVATPLPVPAAVAPKELRSAARRIAKAAEGLKPGELVTPTAAGLGDVALPGETLSIISEVIEKLASGKTPTLVVADNNGDLTAQQAADLLGVSRPHLNQLLEAESIPHHRLTDSPGSHRRIPAAAVLELKARREDSQRNMDELMQLSAEVAD